MDRVECCVGSGYPYAVGRKNLVEYAKVSVLPDLNVNDASSVVRVKDSFFSCAE